MTIHIEVGAGENIWQVCETCWKFSQGTGFTLEFTYEGVPMFISPRDESYDEVHKRYARACKALKEAKLLEAEIETTPEDHEERVWYPISHAACPQCGRRLRYTVDDDQLSLTCMEGLCYFTIRVVGINGEVKCMGCGKPLAFAPKIANMKPITQRHAWLMCSHCGCRS